MRPLRFRFSCWYWQRSVTTRRLLAALPNWLAAIVLGLMLAWFAAQGV